MASLLFNVDNGIAHLIINRPKVKNAFDLQIINDFINYFEIINSKSNTSVNSNDNIKAVIISATGDNFCAGADLKWMQASINDTKAQNLKQAELLFTMFNQLNNLNVPTICAVNGAVFGGGIGLVACCDIAIASEDAIFCFSEVKLGLAPAVICPFVINAIGERAAKFYMLTAEKFNADVAIKLNLIHKLIAGDDLLATASNIANHIANHGPTAIKETKKLILNLANNGYKLKQVKAITTQLIASLRTSPEGQTLMKKFYGSSTD